MPTDLIYHLSQRGRSSGGRWQCPGHDGKGYNLAVWRDDANRKWGLKCWSRDCSLEMIMGGLGLPTSAIYDDAGRDPLSIDYLRERYPGVVNMDAFRAKRKAPPETTPQDRITAAYWEKWGYNACRGGFDAITQGESGWLKTLPCHQLACVINECGPRIEWLRHQVALVVIGPEAYVTTLPDDGRTIRGTYTRQPLDAGEMVVVSTQAQGDEQWGPVPKWAYERRLHDPTDRRQFSSSKAYSDMYRAIAVPLSLSTNNNRKGLSEERDNGADPVLHWELDEGYAVSDVLSIMAQIAHRRPGIVIIEHDESTEVLIEGDAWAVMSASGLRVAHQEAVSGAY